MVKKIILKGRGVVGGVVEGEALVVSTHIHTSGLRDGTITEVDHPQQGVSIKGKILVFNSPAGSSDWGATLHQNCWSGNGPLAIINKKAVPMILTGVIASSVPTVVDVNNDPIKVIDTGDWVKVDSDQGIVEIQKRNKTEG